MNKWILLSLIFVLLSGCASKTPNWKSGELTLGLKAAQAGNMEEAGIHFENACSAKIPGACLSLGLSEELNSRFMLPVKQGHTSDRETVLTVVKGKGANVKVLVWDQDNLELLAQKFVQPVYEDEKVIVKIAGLRPRVEYRLDIYTEEDQLLDSRFFRSLQTEGVEATVVLGASLDDESSVVFEFKDSDKTLLNRRLIPHYQSLGMVSAEGVTKGPDGSYRLRLRGFDFYFMANSSLNEGLQNWLLDSMSKTRRGAVFVGDVDWFKKGEESFSSLFNRIEKQVRAPILFISNGHENSEVVEVEAFKYKTFEVKVNTSQIEQKLVLKNKLGHIEFEFNKIKEQVNFK